MINIIVCIKQVLDPEAPVSAYQVDAEARRVLQRGVPPVLNPFDENALEAALRIKDTQESQITALTMGRGLSKALARKALAAGADQMVLLEDSVFEGLDSYATAFILAAAIRKIGKYDFIFTGREAADTNAGVVGSGIAEILAIPSVTLAGKVELSNDRARIERVVSDGYEVIEAPLPVLVTVSNELGELRSVSVRELMAAGAKPLTTWGADELGIQPSPTGRTNLVNVFIPRKGEARCELAEGGTDEEMGRNLALKLREAGLIYKEAEDE